MLTNKKKTTSFYPRIPFHTRQTHFGDVIVRPMRGCPFVFRRVAQRNKFATKGRSSFISWFKPRQVEPPTLLQSGGPPKSGTAYLRWYMQVRWRNEAKAPHLDHTRYDISGEIERTATPEVGGEDRYGRYSKDVWENPILHMLLGWECISKPETLPVFFCLSCKGPSHGATSHRT